MIKIKSIIFLSLVLFCIGLTVESHQTHVSKPVLSIDKTQYKSGDVVILSGWVNYNDNPTSDVLLRILVTDSKETKIFDGYATSQEDGTFFTEFLIPENSPSGEYKIDVSSLCREVHRDICTHQNEFLTITIEGTASDENVEIPNWIRNNAKWWASGSIGDNDFVSGIQFLINEGIMNIPEIQQISDSDSDHIPSWVKNNAEWWSQGLISDKDFVKGIQFLVEKGIIKI